MWNDINKKLPDSDIAAIVHANNTFYTARFVTKDMRFANFSHYIDHKEMTHWMEIPPLPEETEENNQ